MATENVTPGPGSGGAFTLALGFGRSQQQAVDMATASLRTPFPITALAYTNTWNAYDETLNQPPGSVPGQSEQTIRKTYYLDANVLKASEDKTFPGAVVASLASPWGQAINAGDDVNGKPVYYGSYREIFARDSYEAFTGFLADGDLATARAQVEFLLDDQQLPTGEIPRNSLLNGKAAPDTGGDQLDETADPILMAYLSGLGGDDTLWTQHIKPAADFLVAHGPSYGVERWEEQSGYSPSTIAAEIAGLTAAAAIATEHHDTADAAVYQATADDFQRNVQSWTVTSTGPDSSSPYFIRLSKTGDPNAAITYNLSNGGPTVAQDTVIDGGFQELVRLGELSPNAPVVKNSLSVLDATISVKTPSGTGYYRYGTNAAGRQRRRLRRLLDGQQPDLLHHRRGAVADDRYRHRAPVAGALRRARRVRDRRGRSVRGLLDALLHDQLGLGRGPGARAGVGRPRPGGLAVRVGPDHRVDRLHRRTGGRLGLATDLGPGPGIAPHR